MTHSENNIQYSVFRKRNLVKMNQNEQANPQSTLSKNSLSPPRTEGGGECHTIYIIPNTTHDPHACTAQPQSHIALIRLESPSLPAAHIQNVTVSLHLPPNCILGDLVKNLVKRRPRLDITKH
jgi:hypothetical protein